MEFNQTPFYIIASVDDTGVTLKRGDKTVKRPHNDEIYENVCYLLTKTSFRNLKNADKVHVEDDIVTHYLQGEYLTCCQTSKTQKLDFNEIKGNWIIKKYDHYTVISHLGCCELCSDNHEITVQDGEVRCYDNNYIYLACAKFIKYENNRLSIYNYPVVDYNPVVKSSEIKRVKISAIDKDKVTTNIGRFDRKLFSNVSFDAEYLDTIGGFVEIVDNELKIESGIVNMSDITHVNTINGKIANIFTKDAKICCKNFKAVGKIHIFDNNQYSPWTLTLDENSYVVHTLRCGICIGSSCTIRYNIQKVISHSDLHIIFEHKVNSKTKTSKITLVNTSSGFEMIENDYEFPETTKTTETPAPSTNDTTNNTTIPHLTMPTGSDWVAEQFVTVKLSDRETDAQKAEKLIEIVKKSDLYETTKQEIIRTIITEFQ